VKVENKETLPETTGTEIPHENNHKKERRKMLPEK